MAGTLTAANAVIMLWQSILFPTPVQIQQFATDDVTDSEELRRVEAMMGVDGTLSFGFVFVPVQQSIVLQANSPSIAFFETIDTQQQASEDVYPLNGTLVLPMVAKKYTMINGGLTSVKPTPDVKRTLQPQRYRITWQSVTPSPM